MIKLNINDTMLGFPGTKKKWSQQNSPTVYIQVMQKIIPLATVNHKCIAVTMPNADSN